MPHVTFIHGLANKPPADELHRIWRRALLDDREDAGLDLNDLGVTTSMVYWADVLYPEPVPSIEAGEESAGGALERAGSEASSDVEIPQGVTKEEQRFLEASRQHWTTLSQGELDQAVPPEAAAGATVFERVPLPWFIKKRIMAAYLRDAYLFFFDKEFSPRPGETFRVQKTLRDRFIEDLKAVRTTGKHVVVSHSMGTLIAYDCLKRVADCPPIDSLITMGSPLGVDEVQDCLKPAWSRINGFPAEKIRSSWVNFFDRLDVVCAADPKLGGDFRFGGVDRIQDIAVENEGSWRHSVTKYLSRAAFRNSLRQLLEV